MTEHGINMFLIPVIHFGGPLEPKLPLQMLGVTRKPDGQYGFDFTQVARCVALGRKCGFDYYEWPHLFTGWGAKNPNPVYMRENGKLVPLWPKETTPDAPVFRTFLKQFLDAFHTFLTREKVLDSSYFHVSDEPGGDEHFANYKKVRGMLKEMAPWMKVLDALSEVRYAKEGVCDHPVPLLPHAQEFLSAGAPAWTYFCCGPRGAFLNRLFDTPLAKIRMSGWLFYRTGVRGFLHWGHNYWYQFLQEDLIDPFTVADGKNWPSIPHGDCFMVYPGDNGPIDSIRYEVFAESLQDYGLLQAAKVDPGAKMLAEIKDYADFPKSAEWIEARRRELLA